MAVKILFGAQPSGIANKHTYAIQIDVDSYESGGIRIAVPPSITQPMVFCQATGGYVASWDAETESVMLYESAGTEATAVSGISVTVFFVGQ